MLPGEAEIKQRVFEMVRGFPGAEIVEVVGHLRMEIAGKRFGWCMFDHHGDGRIQINCKARPGVQLSLAQENPVVYHVPAYVGHRGWAGIWLDVEGINWDEVRDLLFEAYLMAAPKKLLKAFE
jgi:hypothetical protein